MTKKEVKDILSGNIDIDSFRDELKTKIETDWEHPDEISVYEIALIKYFNLILFSDILSITKEKITYCKKLDKITNKQRLKGIENAEKVIKEIHRGIDEQKYTKEPKNTIAYREDLESNLESILKDNECLTIRHKEGKQGNGRFYIDEYIELNEIGENLKNKLIRSSAVTHILETYDLLHYLDFDFWIFFVKTRYKDVKFIDHKHNSRDAKIGKFDNIKQVIIPPTDFIPKYVQINSLPSKENVIYRPIRDEITNLLIKKGTKLKNAKEIAGVIVNAYKKLINN